jgi:hypothetical protein
MVKVVRGRARARGAGAAGRPAGARSLEVRVYLVLRSGRATVNMFTLFPVLGPRILNLVYTWYVGWDMPGQTCTVRVC